MATLVSGRTSCGRTRQWPHSSVAALVSGRNALVSGRTRQWPHSSVDRQWPHSSVAALVSGRTRQWPHSSVAALVSGRTRQWLIDGRASLSAHHGFHKFLRPYDVTAHLRPSLASGGRRQLWWFTASVNGRADGAVCRSSITTIISRPHSLHHSSKQT